MALKFRITKAQFEKLSDEIKEHYKADGDDHYKADVTGLDTPDALRRSKERSDARVAELEAEAEELNTKVTTLETDNAKLKTGQTKEGRDVTRLQTKYDRDMASKDAEIDKAKGFVEKALVMASAETIAKEISTVPKLLVNELKSRMKVDFTGEEPVLQILGKDGKPDPKLTLDTLKAEAIANPDYKSIIIASKGSGSAGKPATPTGTGAAKPTPPTIKNVDPTAKVDINALDPADHLARIQERKAATAATA